jgi:hypothetical protein
VLFLLIPSASFNERTPPNFYSITKWCEAFSLSLVTQHTLNASSDDIFLNLLPKRSADSFTILASWIGSDE